MFFYLLAGAVIGGAVVFFGLLIIGIRDIQDQQRREYEAMQEEQRQLAEQEAKREQARTIWEDRGRINLN